MFKSYTSNDNLLLPPCLGDFIPRNDPVRVVHRIIEQINLEALYRLLPPCLGDFIPRNDPVRVVHRIIEQINLEALYRKYSPKGCSAYHPRMMLQILVYAFA